MFSDAMKTKGYSFKGYNHILLKIFYQYHNGFDIESETSACFPQLPTLIVFIFSYIYWYSLI